MQSRNKVERVNFRNRDNADVLVCSAMETCDTYILDTVIDMTFNRLNRLLMLLVEGGGSNNPIKNKRE